MSTPVRMRDPAERRKEPRYTPQLRVFPGITEAGIGFDAEILDVSRSGLRVRSNRPLERTAIVSLLIDSLDVEGQVRYCRRNEDGTFDVGLLICNATKG